MRTFTLKKHTYGTTGDGYIASNDELTCTGKTAEDALWRLCVLAGIGDVQVRSFFEMSELLNELIGGTA